MKENYSFLSTKTKDTRRAFNHIQILLRESENSYVLILSKGGAKTKNTQMREKVVSSSSRCYYYSYCFLRLLNFCFATVYSSLYVEEGGAGPDGALGGGGRGGGGAPEGA